MADVINVDDISMGQRIAQMARAGVPFNPLSRADIYGGNVSRLTRAMTSYGWTDPRFLTRAQAQANGWLIDAEAVELDVFIHGYEDMTSVVNASYVSGMPSLLEMTAMSDVSLMKLKGFGVEELMLRGFDLEELENQFVISPAVEQSVSLEANFFNPKRFSDLDADSRQSPLTASAYAQADHSHVDAVETHHEQGDVLDLSGQKQKDQARFAVMAPYWNSSGLHNSLGLAAAAQLNKTILARNLSLDREAIARLLSLNEDARLLGLSVVDENLYLNDPDLRKDAARPATLLGGELVRDKDGAYRQKEGGPVVLQDKGDSLVLQNKTDQAFRGAMQLAVAKGWKAIELKGKPAALSEAWIEAKLMGLDVINYKPNEKDLEKFEARLALESQRNLALRPSQSVDQPPELVVEQAFVNEKGLTEIAVLIYTVSFLGGKPQRFDSAKDAAAAFSGLPASEYPVVVRSVVRAAGEVIEGVVAGVVPSLGSGGAAQVFDSVLDREFDEAMETIINERELQGAAFVAHPSVTEGPHSGAILMVDGGRIAQDAGQGRIVWHDVANLRGKIPVVGKKVDINYSKGLGLVKEIDLAVESGVER